MLLLQTPWTPTSLALATVAVSQSRMTMVDDAPPLVLLPHADGPSNQPPTETDCVAGLAAFAKASGSYVGASATVRADDVTRTMGFLFGPDGQLLLRVPKILPDLVEGYTDTAAETFAPATPAIARTPHGQIGVLCGEDILSPHIVRMLMTAGAEIILNPARERADERREIRLAARGVRAYENLLYVATASPSTVQGVVQAPSTGLYPPTGAAVRTVGAEAFLKVDVDIEALRRRRLVPPLNFAAITRMNVYAAGYAAETHAAQPSPRTRAAWIAEGRRRAAASAKPARPDAIDSYGVLLCQHVVHQAHAPDQLVPLRQKNLNDAFDLVRSYIARASNAKLIVFPEFFLTGPVSPLGDRLGHLASDIGVTFPGPEMDQIAAFAQASKAYVAGGVFEYDPAWPERFFNTAFIYDDRGNLILRYRKIHCGDSMGPLPVTTPGSLYDRYVEMYGYEALFPVVDTPIGRLSTVICFDNNFPETHRALARRGAEILIHPTSEPHGGHRGGWDMARRMRGFENTAYVLSCGHGGEYFLPGRIAPSSRARGYSKIVNFDGSVQAEADTAGQVPLGGTIDLRALRKARADVQTNLLLWDDPTVYGAAYAKTPRGLPNNLWTDDPRGNPYAGGAQIKRVIEAYVREGIFVAPQGVSRPDVKAAE